MFSMSLGVTFGRPLIDGTTSSSAPRAYISWKRSSVKQSAITMRARYPFARQTSASAGPVLPPVYSTTVSPGESSPSRSAPSIIASAIRSFIEPLGLRFSSLSQSSAPLAGAQRRRRTSGVLPIASSIESTLTHVYRVEAGVGRLPRGRDEVDEHRPEAVRRVEPREVSTTLDDREAPDPGRQPLDDLARGRRRRNGVHVARADERRAGDMAELVQRVESLHQLAAAFGELEVLAPARQLVRI